MSAAPARSCASPSTGADAVASSDLSRILTAFSEAFNTPAVLWRQPRPDRALEVAATTGGDVTPPDVAAIPADGTIVWRQAAVGRQLIARLPGRSRAWLGVGPVRDEPEARRWCAVLVPALAEVLQAQWESRRAADELVERYEEITLLYSISEILSRTVTFEAAARRILLEVAETVGAEYGALVRHDPASGLLVPVTSLRVPRGAEPRTIPVDHPVSVLARVYRTRHALLVDDGVLVSEFEVPFRDGALLAVPILWTTPDGGLPVGVICLSGRRGGLPFTAGDEKFVAAIGSQIGSAIQNGVLVRQSLEQERLQSEMRLAHDLQQRLLPKGTAVSPEARCAARVEAAEGVGGDFYHLFRLDGGSTGVLLGDVSGHGYRAALVMALVMSAAAIHARGNDDPARTVEAILATVRDELADTEMFLSLCYVIVDHRGGAVRWTNTGHPHAFVIRGDGTVDRLAATDPALGLGTEPLSVATRAWDPAADLLAIFTDGVSDARDADGRALGEAAVLDVLVARRREVPSRIVDGVFAQVSGHLGRLRPHDDQAVVVLRSA